VAVNAEDSGVFCSECGDELDEVSGVCACAFTPRDPKPPKEGVVVTSMRDMAARRLAARTPGEVAIARLSMDARRALVAVADGRPIGRRIASSLAERGMLRAVPLEVAPPKQVHCELTPLGHEVARIESQRERCRKEKNEASAGVE
jgi:hypothetical protein